MIAAGVSSAAHSPLLSSHAACARFWPSPGIDTGGVSGPDWTLARDFLADPEQIEALLAYQRSFTPDLDRKGQAAYAIGDYSHMLATAFVPLFVGYRLVADIAPESCAVGFDRKPVRHRGMDLEEWTWRLRLPDPAASTDDAGLQGNDLVSAHVATGELRERFRAGLEAHLAPLVEMLHRKTSLSASALWRLAGDSISQLFLDAGRRFGRLESAKADAMAILKAEGSPLANRQMHYFDICIEDVRNPGATFAVTYRARGGCCRFYTVEGGHLCSTCVLQDPERRDARLEENLRRRMSRAVVANS